MSQLLTPLPLALLDSVLSTVAVIVGVGFLIFIHEAGHFLVAKWNKVRVEAFSLGFGPVLFGFMWKGTHYRLSAIPLGGYVKMAGETPTDEHTNDPAELMNKSVPVRALIFVAGVTMNMLVAFVLFVVAFRIGVPLPSPVVGSVDPGSPASKAGLMPGDRILSVDGAKILDFQDVFYEVAYSDGPIDIEVSRNGKKMAFKHVEPVRSQIAGLRLLGIQPCVSRRAVVVENSPAFKAGLRTGDEIQTVDGIDWSDIYDVQRRMATAPPPIRFIVKRSGKRLSFDVTPTTRPKPNSHGIIGISQLLDRVGFVETGSAAARKGLKAGDAVVAVNGNPVPSVPAAEAAAKKAAPSPVVFTVRRDKKLVRLPAIRSVSDAQGWVDFFDAVTPTCSTLTTTAVSLTPAGTFKGEAPARKAGITEGSRILTIDGTKVSSFHGIQTAIESHGAGKPVKVTFLPYGAKQATGPVTIVPRVPVYRDYGFPRRISPQTETVKLTDIVAATAAGLHRSVVTGRQILQMIAGLFSGRVSPKNLGGPVMIFEIAHSAVQKSFLYFLYFLGILSVNLAILNILPIPVLDGGNLFLLAIEAIRRKRLSERTMAAFQFAGLLVLGLLMLFVIVQDLGR